VVVVEVVVVVVVVVVVGAMQISLAQLMVRVSPLASALGFVVFPSVPLRKVPGSSQHFHS